MRTQRPKKDGTKYIVTVAIGVQFLLIFCMNYFKAEKLLDFDASMAVRHAVEMWRNGTIFLQNFGYTTSMEIDCAAFFAAPIYMITGNYGLGIAIVHLVLDGILAYGIYHLLKNMDVSYEFRMFAVLLVFLPYQAGQLLWDNMLFLSVGQYEFRVTSAILLFMLLGYAGEWRVSQWIELVICEFYIGFTVLSAGNYLLIVLLVPVVLYEIFAILTKEKVEWKDRGLRLAILSMAVGCLAFALRMAMHISTNRGNMNIIKETEFADNILACFTGVIALFGGLPNYDQKVIAVDGIGLFARFAAICVILGVGVAALRQRKRMEQKQQNFMVRFLFLLGINMLVFLYTNTTYGSIVFEYRYHMIWCILLITIDVMFMARTWEGIGSWKKTALVICIVAGIIIIDVNGFVKLAGENWLNEGVIDLTLEEANKNGVTDIVVVDGVTARQMTAVDIDKNVQFAGVNEEMASLGFNTWGASMDTHVDAKNIMAIREEDLQKLSTDILQEYTEVSSLEEWHMLYTETYSWN